MENPVLEYTILKPEGILVLKPNESLSKEDFAVSALPSIPTSQTMPASTEC